MTREGGKSIVARCHCGQVSIELPRRPSEVSECNCSWCRKSGFRGIYYSEAEIAVTGTVDPYVRSDVDEACLTNWHCRRCGCATHWTGIGIHAGKRVGINARLLDEALLDGLPVKEVDGASW